MADRSIAVRLSLQDNYSAGIRRAGQATDEFARKGEAAGRSAKTAQGGLAGMAGLMPGVSTGAMALGGGLAYAGKTVMDFEKAMSGVRANVDATPQQFAALTESVKRSGTAFGFSATESAAAAEDLAKAGLKTTEIMGGGLSGALTLAAAGSVSTGRAAEVAATAMTMFHKKASDVGHIADVLSNGANMSTASVDSLAQGMQQGGLQAAQMGMSLEDTVATLAAFDQAGLKGGDAGTSLKNMLSALANPSKQAAQAMDELGINAFDAQGKFVGMQALADQLKGSLGGLTEEQRNAALSTIFGADASRAASIAMDLSSNAAKNGGKSFSTWAQEMQKSGTAAENARTRTDNLAGDLRKLKSAADNALISLGQSGTGPLREFVQIATGAIGVVGGLVGTLGKVPGPVLAIAAAMAAGRLANNRWGESLNLGGRVSGATSNVRAFTGALGELSRVQRVTAVAANGSTVALSGMAAKVATLGGAGSTLERMSTSFTTTAASAQRLPRATGLAAAGLTGLKGAGMGLMGLMGGPLGLAITGVGVGLSMLAQRHAEAAEKAANQKAFEEQLASTLDKTTGAATRATREMAAQKLESDGMLQSAQKYKVSLSDMTDVMLGVPGALDRVNSSLDAQQKAYGAAHQSNTSGVQKTDFALKKFQETVNSQAGEAQRAAESNKRLAEAVKENGTAAGGAKSGVQALAEAEKAAQTEATKFDEALSKVNNHFLALSGSEIGVRQAIDSATEAFAKNGRNVDISTKAGQENMSMLNSAAAGMQKNLEALRASGTGAQEVATKTASYRAELTRLGTAAGLSGQKLADYVAQALEVPDNITTTINTETTAAVRAMATVDSNLKKLNGQTLTINAKKLPDNVVGDLLKVETARKHADGTITITANKNNVDAMRVALKDVKDKAVLANGTIVNIPASSNAPQIKALIESLDATAVSTNGSTVTINTRAPMAVADRKKIQDLGGTAVKFNGTTVTINSKALTADSLAKIRALLAAAQDKTNVITTIHRVVNQAVGDNQRAAAADRRNARGGIWSGGVRQFARGGIEEHDPQIAIPTAGRVRIWAEPETKGEAYIPFANDSRRPRAKQITEHVARKFGGSVTWHANGSADDWAPDMSGIMALAQSLKVDPTALGEQRTRVKDQTTALTKATRDLAAARQRLARASSKNRLAAENAVASAIEKQAKASRDLAASKSKLSTMEAGAKTDTTGRFLLATTSTNATSKKFLDNLERIKKRGFGRLALSLLEQGDSDAQAIAQTLVGGSLLKLQQADKGLATSDALADRKATLLSELKGAAGLTATARQEANAQLLAMRGANATAYYSSGPAQISTANVERVVADLSRQVQTLAARPMQVTVVSQLDSQIVGRTVAPVVFAEGAKQYEWGTT